MKIWSVSVIVLGGGLVFPYAAHAGGPLCRDLFLKTDKVGTLLPDPSLSNVYRKSLEEKLAEQLQKLVSSSENLANTIERLIAIEATVAQKTGREMAPEIASTTRRALLKIYGDTTGMKSVDRGALVVEARAALKQDPYFNWLIDQKWQPTVSESKTQYSIIDGKPVSDMSPRDPVSYLESLLLVARVDSLPLELALWKTRAEFDPQLHIGTRAAIDTLVHSYKQQMVLEGLIDKMNPQRPFAIAEAAWQMARTLEDAKVARMELRRSIRAQAEDKLPLSVYEKLREQLTLENSDVEMVRQYILTQPGGIYHGKFPEAELKVLENEMARIRDEWRLGNNVIFDASFLKLWPMIWGQQLSYEMVLVRAYFPTAEAQRVETLLRDLDLIVEMSLALTTDAGFRDFLSERVR